MAEAKSRSQVKPRSTRARRTKGSGAAKGAAPKKDTELDDGVSEGEDSSALDSSAAETDPGDDGAGDDGAGDDGMVSIDDNSPDEDRPEAADPGEEDAGSSPNGTSTRASKTKRKSPGRGRKSKASADEPSPDEEDDLEPKGPGDKLREAREAKGLSLAEVSQETRIPVRQLEMMEAGDFTGLPARTYAVGFSRNYARAVGIDGDEIASEVNAQFGYQAQNYSSSPVVYEAGDPGRAPSRKLGWVMLGAFLLLAIGVWSFTSSSDNYSASLPAITSSADDQDEASKAKKAAVAEAPTGGPVTFTATEDGVWVRFYDADGNTLIEKQMAKGESYTVPEDANTPMVWTGRPDAFAISIGGREVPRLAEEDKVMRDVPVTAKALLARGKQAGEGEGEVDGGDSGTGDGSAATTDGGA